MKFILSNRINNPEKFDLFFSTPTEDALAYAYETLESNCLNFAKRKYGDSDFYMEHFKKEMAFIKEAKLAYHFMIMREIARRAKLSGFPIVYKENHRCLLVAYFSQISSVNPLEPHYYCKQCKHIEYIETASDVYDCSEKYCPNCGEKLSKSGHNIPLTEKVEKYMTDSRTPFLMPDFELEISLTMLSQLESDLQKAFGQVKSYNRYHRIGITKSSLCELLGQLKKSTGASWGNIPLSNKELGMSLFFDEYYKYFNDDFQYDNCSFYELIKLFAFSADFKKSEKTSSLSQLRAVSIQKVYNALRLEWYKQNYGDEYIQIMEHFE